MVNSRSILNYVMSFIFFLIVFVSFFLLIKSGVYRNFIVFVLAASSFLLGYFIRRRNDNVEEINPKSKDAEIPATKKIPQEFLDEQKRYEKLSSGNKEGAGAGQ